MSTSGDEERLLSDSSATDGMENQVDDVDKQLVIENTFAEDLEEEEDQKGDSVGINIPGRSILAQVNPTGEKPKVQVEDSVGIEAPGRSVIACVDPAKQKAVDTPLPHDPYQVTGPLPPDPYQPAAPSYNPAPSTSLPPEGGGVMMKTTPLDDRSTAVLLVCQGKEEVNTQKETGEQEEATTREKEEQEAKTQEEEQEEARTQEKEEKEAKTQEEEKEAKTQEEEKEEAQKELDEQEEAKITEREQETVGSPPTYEKATDDVPPTSKITPEDVKTAVKKVGPPTPSEPPLPTPLDPPQQTPLEPSAPLQPPPPKRDPPQHTPIEPSAPPQPPPPKRDPPQHTPIEPSDPPQPPPPKRDPPQHTPIEPSDPLQPPPPKQDPSQHTPIEPSDAVRLMQLITLLQSIAMKLGDTAPRIGALLLLTSALKSSHRAPKESDSNPQSCPCCSCLYKNCACGYMCNKIKWMSLKGGFLTALKQWKGGMKNVACKQWKRMKKVITFLILLWRSGKIAIYIGMLVYQFVQLGLGIQKSIATGFILFVALSPFFSAFGVLVSLAHWLFFYIPNRKKINETWCACCGWCIRVLCRVCKCMLCCKNQEVSESGEEEDTQKREESKRGEEEDSRKKGEESKRGEDKDSAKTKEIEGTEENLTGNHSTRASICCTCDEWQSTMKRLNSSPGRVWIILGNIVGSLITVLDEILGTVTFILTLYAFIGNEGFNFHRYTPGDWVKFLFAYVLPAVIIIFSHIIRIGEICVNVKSLDKDIDSIPDEDIKRSQSEKIFSFQHGIIFHAVASGFLQVWFLVVLSWKIIRDHCLSQSEALELGILTNNAEVYVGPLARCYVPDLRPNTINYFTVINIIYITIIFPILSYLILFISNLPLFVEYTQRLHVSGLYKVEEMLSKALPGDERGMQSGIHKFFSIFFEIINVKLDKAFLLTKKKEIAELRKAVQKDMLGYYKKSSRKFQSTIFSLPTFALGVIHVGLFLMNIGFLSCRYSLATNSLECSSSFDSFGAFTGFLSSDEALLITPLLILFFLTGFPGPVITMLWIFVIIGILMLIGSVILLIVLAVALIFILGACGNSSTRTTRYYH